MTEKCLITISQSCEKYDLNRNTLLSWVRTKKVGSCKKLVGQKAVHHIDEESLKRLLAKRSPEKLRLEKPETPADPPPLKETPPSSEEATPEEEPGSNGTSPPGAMKQRKINREDAKRRKQNHVQRVKNFMRGFTIEDLSRVNAWIGCRMLEQMKTNGDPNPKK
jgi:hypothetical protein